MLERTFREEAGRLTASLVRLLGDFDLAEELVADAVVEALAHWPTRGVPDRPGAWLLTTARRKAIDRVRRDGRGAAVLGRLAGLPASVEREPDDRLRLIFTCCHPSLAPEAQLALTLRAVAGLSTAEIARALLIPEATLAKRLVRAKAKITSAGIPYRTPEPEELPERLGQVLRVVYLVLNEGLLTTAGADPARRELADDARWLATLLVHALPAEPEPLGLLALVQLHLARWEGRFDPDGRLVTLDRQDRSRWDQAAIAGAGRLLRRAAKMGRPGPYQLEAAILAVHCEAPTWEDTDWAQLLVLHTLLAAVDPSPVVRLNRAVVLARTAGPTAALAELDALARPLGGYHLWHATRAELLRQLGRPDEAARADAAALGRTANPAERALLGDRLAGRGVGSGTLSGPPRGGAVW